MRRLLLAGTLLALALTPVAEARTKRVSWAQNAAVADRFWDQVGFGPVNGILTDPDATTVRSGSTTYKVNWVNSLFNRRTTRAILKEIHRDARFPPVSTGAFVDSPLRGKWKARFDVLLDLARDADVLAVRRGHPACESGLTRAQARGIARGEITQWSGAGVSGLGAIRRRLSGSDAFAQPRFGAPKKPGKAVVRSDGGISEAADDDAVAAITAWSRVRGNGSVCAVPIDGVRPTDQTVFRREYRPAYAIRYVMHAKRRRDRQGKALVKAYVNFLRSDGQSESFRNAGVLLVRDGEPTGAPPSAGGGGSGASQFPAPTHDYAGRPITPTRDDGAGAEAMSGRRLQDTAHRLVFEPDGTFGEFVLDENGTCISSTYARWGILEAYTYPEQGGGLIARVRAIHSDHERLYTVELPGDQPGVAYVDGQPYADDPSLSGTCG